ncbi:MAG: GAF domain-containing protein, partial [Bacteroidetes bacterium]
MRVLPGSEFPKSALFVPLIIDEKVTGYVSLQNVDIENAFIESDARLLETLAHSMSSALENARLLKETEQRTAELAVINSVQEALAKEMDMQAIYDLVGNRIRELFDAQAVGIATFDHKSETEHIHYLIEKGERYYPAPRPLNILRKHLIATREKILINKNFEEVAATFGVKKVPGTEQPKSAVYVPLMVGEKVTGNISLQNIDRENAISDSDVRLLETLANSMSVALENARLFDETNRLLKETEQQKAELGVINSVQEGLAKELDMQAIYDLVGNRIRELFNAQAVIIANFDHDTATEHFKYLIEDGQRFYLPSRPYDKLRQHLIVSRQKIVINANYAEAYARFDLKILPGTNMTKSGVFVPLVTGDKVNSYISLQNNEIENAFSESDIRLLETLANTMSVALENARLFDETTRLLKETEQRTAELAVINSVQEGLARELEMKAIYELVGNKIREVFDAQVVIIATFDHETGTERFHYMIEKGEKFYPEPRRYDKLRYQLITNRQKILINNNVEQALTDFGLKVIQGTEMPRSLLYVPLIVGNKVTSYVSLQNLDKDNAFSDSDVRLLETLANSMSVALENARLFDETNRLLKETEQGKAELAVINSVQEGLAHELDINGIYKLVGDRIQKLFNAQAVIIASFDHDRRLEFFNYHFEKGEISFPDPRPYDKVRKHLIETGQNILINENSDQAIAEFGLRVVPGTEMPKSMLFMPMKVGDKVNGYVSLQNIDQENAFSYSDVRLLSTLANSMSVALENARLFDETNRLLKETEQRTAELAVINSVQEGLAKELNIQGIYELVGEKLREIFNAQVIDIVSYDASINMMKDHYSYEKGDRTLVGTWEPKGFRKHAIDTKQLMLINEDLDAKTVEFGTPLIMGEVPKSAVFVPLISGNDVKGMISLQDLDKEHAFSDADVRLLKTLANSMTVALENARLFDKTTTLLKETEQRNAQLAVINSVQESLVAQMDIDGIYELVGEKMREIFDPQVIDIVTYDSKANLIEDKYAYEKGDRTLVGPRQPNGFRKHVIDTGQNLLHNSGVEKAVRELGNEILFGDMPKSQIYVPMIAAGKVTGIISLQNIDHENAFSDSDVSLLSTLANSMSVALESARLFDETNRLLKETEQRNAELA